MGRPDRSEGRSWGPPLLWGQDFGSGHLSWLQLLLLPVLILFSSAHNCVAVVQLLSHASFQPHGL